MRIGDITLREVAMLQGMGNIEPVDILRENGRRRRLHRRWRGEADAIAGLPVIARLPACPARPQDDRRAELIAED